MAAGAGAGATLIGWAITGIGMIALAFVYQELANRKPNLNAAPMPMPGRIWRLHRLQ